MNNTQKPQQSVNPFFKKGDSEVKPSNFVCNSISPLSFKRTKCEIYTRVVGYLRPVQQFNEGKQSEFKDRKNFKLGGKKWKINLF